MHACGVAHDRHPSPTPRLAPRIDELQQFLPLPAANRGKLPIPFPHGPRVDYSAALSHLTLHLAARSGRVTAGVPFACGHMLRLGIVDFDSSHCIEFTRRFNHVGLTSDQYVDGARVVAGWPGTSEMAPERIPGFRDDMLAAGVPLVDAPDDLIGQIDAVLILSLCGAAHLERVRPFLAAGIPAYVDKPFACNLSDALQILDLARTTGVTLAYASALRYAAELDELRTLINRSGGLVGLLSCGPAKRAAMNPGLFHYGIHAIEVLYALMGPGCTQVSNAYSDGAEIVTGRWTDGRLATVRGARAGATAYCVTAFCNAAVLHQPVSTRYAYRNLCRAIVRSLSANAPLVPYHEIEEVTRFVLAAQLSEQHAGDTIHLASLSRGAP